MSKSNIVDFPSSKRPTPEEVAAHDRRSREERISRLREVLGENPTMGREDLKNRRRGIIPIPVFRIWVFARLVEPGMFIGGVIHHEVD